MSALDLGRRIEGAAVRPGGRRDAGKLRHMHGTKGARAMKRFGSATWDGDLREGRGMASFVPEHRMAVTRARTQRINAIGTS